MPFGKTAAGFTARKHSRAGWQDLTVARDRDVAAFDRRSAAYEAGWRGRLHRDIAEHTLVLASRPAGAARRILDVGCGTGYLLRRLALLAPAASELIGIDPAPGMIAAARASAADPRLRFLHGAAEQLPFPAESFELVVSTTSFDHWVDQQAGLGECARVLSQDGCLILSDQFSAWLLPTLLLGRRGRARTKRQATQLLLAAGFRAVEWHASTAVVIGLVSATK